MPSTVLWLLERPGLVPPPRVLHGTATIAVVFVAPTAIFFTAVVAHTAIFFIVVVAPTAVAIHIVIVVSKTVVFER